MEIAYTKIIHGEGPFAEPEVLIVFGKNTEKIWIIDVKHKGVVELNKEQAKKLYWELGMMLVKSENERDILH